MCINVHQKGCSGAGRGGDGKPTVMVGMKSVEEGEGKAITMVGRPGKVYSGSGNMGSSL